MKINNIYNSLFQAKINLEKKFVVLIDPDEVEAKSLEKMVNNCVSAEVDYFFLGGSLVVNNNIELAAKIIKKNSDIPIILFPGDTYQLNNNADALLLLSLISGRNPELLIGKHVTAAPYLKKSNLEIMPTGYLLVDGGVPTTVSYISNTNPLPADKENIALCTAQAGEMLGLKLIYLDAGSGALNPVPRKMIQTVADGIDVPLIVGGGIRNPEKAYLSAKAGADAIVVGNAIEKDESLIQEMAHAVHSANPTTKIIQ